MSATTRTKNVRSGSIKKTRTRKEGGRQVIYPQVSVRLCQGKDAITVETAKQLLGWEEEEEEKFGTDYLLKNKEGKKVRCTNNRTNRPISKATLATLKQELLRGKWQFNGEPVIVGRTGVILNGQHSLLSLIHSEEERVAESDTWKDLHPKPLRMDKLVVFGVSEQDQVVNTIDTCRPRSLSDVIFRSGYFQDLKTSDRKVVAKMTDYAVRLLWYRTGGGLNAFAPKRTHSESLDFIDRHPRILECVKHVWEEDSHEKNISKYCSAGYAAGLLYLMGSCQTNPEEYRASENPSEDCLDWNKWEDACDFFVLLAGGAKETNVIRTALGKIIDDGGGSQKERWALLIKAWNVFSPRKFISKQSIELKYQTDENGIRQLVECPSVGGIDLGNPDEIDEEHIVAKDPTPEEIEERKKQLYKPTKKASVKKTSIKKRVTKKKTTKKKTSTKDRGVYKIGDVVLVSDSQREDYEGRIKAISAKTVQIVVSAGFDGAGRTRRIYVADIRRKVG